MGVKLGGRARCAWVDVHVRRRGMSGRAGRTWKPAATAGVASCPFIRQRCHSRHPARQAVRASFNRAAKAGRQSATQHASRDPPWQRVRCTQGADP